MKVAVGRWIRRIRPFQIDTTQEAAAKALKITLRTLRSWEQRGIDVDVHTCQGAPGTLLARLAGWSRIHPDLIELQLGLIPSSWGKVSTPIFHAVLWVLEHCGTTHNVQIRAVGEPDHPDAKYFRVADNELLETLMQFQRSTVALSFEFPTTHFQLLLDHNLIFDLPPEDSWPPAPDDIPF